MSLDDLADKIDRMRYSMLTSWLSRNKNNAAMGDREKYEEQLRANTRLVELLTERDEIILHLEDRIAALLKEDKP